MKDNFTVIHETNNISKAMNTFKYGEELVPLLTTETLHVGFDKAFNVVYFEVSVPNATPAKIAATYDNAAGLQTLKICDETNGFTKSGFITFERPTDPVKTTIETEEKIYIHFQTDTDLDPTTKFKGVGIVFNTNEDLEAIRSNIRTTLNDGESLIHKIELAKDTIVQMLNNQGNVKIVQDNSGSLTSGTYMQSITEFDFLSITQLRLASTYLAASLLYLEELSDDVGDKWEMQGKRHRVKFNDLFNIYLLKIDLDNDGQASTSEVSHVDTITITLD